MTYNYKAPQDVIFDLPQERITGDILKGRGPRRGNLERLLRYWRPIMRKPGGFRRCKVILANHPELYPLNNICAWLHHETTGLWPNEGCHHPGMKNCKRKMKNIKNGSIWSENDWKKRMASRFGKNKSLSGDVTLADMLNIKQDMMDSDENYVVTQGDMKHAILVLRDFVDMETEFCKYLQDDSNWEIEGDDPMGQMMKMDAPFEEDCGCDK
jgi:hypothetical protein